MKLLICTGWMAAAIVTAPMCKAADRVKTANGTVEAAPDSPAGVRIFRGIPYAAPPTGELRWRPPQDAANWEGVRVADKFGPRCMQHPIFGDMNFRSNGVSEDCLYLNVWTPAKSARERLPVLVYFYGGGFMAGDGSEPRYEGESMARKGIVALTVNYRLAVFGFFAHPELTKESPHHASGNYGLMDQSAALHWVKKNIAAFGGDPDKITIAGESAGSASVCAQMISPLSRDLIAGAIGESGSVLGSRPMPTLAQSEESGVKFASTLGASSLSELRALTTQQLMDATSKPGVGRFSMNIDGYFFPEAPSAIYAAGKQARVPLLAGWNSEESGANGVLQRAEPTPENYAKAIRTLYPHQADEVLKLYPASTREEVLQAATDLAGDRFIAFSTWKWADLHAKNSGKPVYRYFYTRPRPEMTPEFAGKTPGLAGGVISTPGAAPPPRPRGAVHSAEIEYAMGNLVTNKVYAWKPEDYKVSKLMQEYFANFIKTGNPNGKDLPKWPALAKDGNGEIMRIDVDSAAVPQKNRPRYEFLDSLTR